MCIRSTCLISCVYYSTCSAGYSRTLHTYKDKKVSVSPVMDPEFQWAVGGARTCGEGVVIQQTQIAIYS